MSLSGESPLQRPATLVLDRPSSSYFLADFTNSRRQHGSVGEWFTTSSLCPCETLLTERLWENDNLDS